MNQETKPTALNLDDVPLRDVVISDEGASTRPSDWLNPHKGLYGTVLMPTVVLDEKEIKRRTLAERREKRKNDDHPKAIAARQAARKHKELDEAAAKRVEAVLSGILNRMPLKFVEIEDKMTFAYYHSYRSIYVSSALRNPKDRYNKTMGRLVAAEAMVQGECLRLPIKKGVDIPALLKSLGEVVTSGLSPAEYRDAHQPF